MFKYRFEISPMQRRCRHLAHIAAAAPLSAFGACAMCNALCWQATDAIRRVYVFLCVFEMPPPIKNPADHHLFLHLKKHLGGQRHDDDDEVKTSVVQWLSNQAADFYEDGIQKLVVRYDKCLNTGGNYVEK